MQAISVVDSANYIVNSFDNANSIQIVNSLPNTLTGVSLL